MPPRKRAAAAPTADSTFTPDADPSAPPAPDQADVTTQEPSTDPQHQADADASKPGDGDGASPAADKKPTKSDLQKVEQPCSECFPDGWGDGFFARGCEHGTWARDNLD